MVVRPLAAQAGKRIVHVEDEAVLEKTSYSPNFEVSREFHSGSIAADPNCALAHCLLGDLLLDEHRHIKIVDFGPSALCLVFVQGL